MGAPVAKQIITLKKTLRQPSPDHRSSLLRPCVSICLSSYFTGEFGSILHCPPNFIAFSIRPVFSILYTVVRDTPMYSANSSGDMRRLSVCCPTCCDMVFSIDLHLVTFQFVLCAVRGIIDGCLLMRQSAVLNRSPIYAQGITYA